ncbi:MSMEG_0567/Sll0786 family nitrogen starvation N-acetyltransferase [Alloalcanivorax mobilis]|uniref:MSMEG_0567/Sll0786 family nitrogen starvation N-acetyltransferase n=1 Tax=Alloalcanivorax mobilis TaxID=2019569 RepID=UPI000B5B3504|nr:MSMEG_0567/Sll0786 family nitrogen starvation N-acetyltransferase [Alloalcanivorax mobilis]ASK34411.1 histone acetyltransferase [Alcanivorax sp. N3-2A]|tara:strand:- start:10792 stop:11334 length:543 start_codon:yes stop_codon:yes gene_type:complete
MILEPVVPFRSCEYAVKLTTEAWEYQAARELRRQVFCAEQGLFTADDGDALDRHALTVVALAYVAGGPDEVVGTVRIHSDRPGIWYGSRLAVARGYRRDAHLGSALIRLAVGGARARGCDSFFARVQAVNEPLFQRLHWRTLRHLDLHGLQHVLMRAELDHYPPLAEDRLPLLTTGRRAS